MLEILWHSAMPKYLYAQNVTKEELLELKSFKKKGAKEFVRGRIIELSSDEEHPEEISRSVDLPVGRVREWIRRYSQQDAKVA